MAHVAEEMERLGMKQPLLIGGATTSKIHTAVKISPHYSHPVVYVKDASKSVPVVSSLLSDDQRDNFTTQLKNEYKDLRDTYLKQESTDKISDPGRSTCKQLKIDWAQHPPLKPKFIGTKVYKDYPWAKFAIILVGFSFLLFGS